MYPQLHLLDIRNGHVPGVGGLEWKGVPGSENSGTESTLIVSNISGVRGGGGPFRLGICFLRSRT